MRSNSFEKNKKSAREENTDLVFSGKWRIFINDSHHWLGVCLDTGAQTTVVWISQVRAYCPYMGVKSKPKKNNHKYKFWFDRQTPLDSTNIGLPIPNNEVIKLPVDVVNANVPFLIDLYFLDKYRMSVNTVCNLHCAPLLKWQIPLIRKRGHVYLEWKNEDTILLKRQESMKLNSNFAHLSAEKLYNLLKVPHPWETDFWTK